MTLSTYGRSNSPVLIQPNGKYQTFLFNPTHFDNFHQGGVTENFEFTINDDTEVRQSCSALLNGDLFVFGGTSTQRQVIEKVLINKTVFSRFRKFLAVN